MAKSHESKLFIVRTHYKTGTHRHHVFRTRAAARTFQSKQKLKRGVQGAVVFGAIWGPDK